MRTTLDYVQKGSLNNAASTSKTGSAEPITGAPIATGLNSGDFLEVTDAQALSLSTAGTTLYSGVYQWVKISAAATGLAVGQPLFWLRSDTSDPYVVTNATGATDAYDYAGTLIDSGAAAGSYCWIQVTGRINGKLASGAIGDWVTFPTSGSDTYAASATAPTAPNGVGIQATAVASGLALIDTTKPQIRF